ncbi:hypothetical protein M1N64_04010 [Peptococcaceae bacterium]|nr:hypothetical protein [Peptococcaceae bacterium]
MKKEITDKNYDLIFKMASEAFKHKMLHFLGVDAPEITEILPTELPAIEANVKHTDFIFRLADESLLHLEFQIGYTGEDTYRFLTYDVRLHKKYRQKIRTVVVYIRDAAKITHQITAGSITQASGDGS